MGAIGKPLGKWCSGRGGVGGGVSEPRGAGGRWSREVASPVSQLCLGVALAQLPGVSDR